MAYASRLIAAFLLSTTLFTAPSLAEMKMATADLGSLKITDGWLKVMIPGAKVAGGYLTIENTGDTPDRLVAVKAAFANKNEIHEMAMKNDVMVMRPLADGIEIPAGEKVVLKPGSFHLMFMGVTDPVEKGEENQVTLVFEKAGELTIAFPAHEAAMHKGH